jgi:cytochrome b6-f complex iron-sulfur subunit
MEKRNSSDPSRNRIARRRIIRIISGFWAFGSLATVAGVLLRYLTPPVKGEVSREVLEVGSLSDIQSSPGRIVRFNRDPVIVVRLDTGQLKAFGARCTHLGCVVQFKSEEPPHFACNCHGSQFDISGKNIAGPAPRPLTPFRIIVKDEKVFLTRV